VNRWDFERTVLGSELPPPARHVLHVLTIVADWPGGVIPAQFTKSLSELATLTGLGRSTVARTLNLLEEFAWVDRKRPTKERAQSAKERTQYRLRIPAGASPRAGLVPERDQIASPTAGLASPTAGPVLVPERDGASPRAGHKPDPFQTYQTSSSEDVVSQATGATPEEAAAVANRVRNEKQPRNLIGLLRRMAADGDLRTLLTEHRAAVIKAKVSEQISNARGGPECDHGTPGGAAPHPITQQPLCPLCRAKSRWVNGVTA
jgi:hypothetical protein